MLVISHDAIDQLTVLDIPWHDGGKALPLMRRPFPRIEPQLPLPVLLIGSMTGETSVRQKLTNVFIEADFGTERRKTQNKGKKGAEKHQKIVQTDLAHPYAGREPKIAGT